MQKLPAEETASARMGGCGVFGEWEVGKHQVAGWEEMVRGRQDRAEKVLACINLACP